MSRCVRIFACVLTAFFGLGLAFAHEPGDELKPELDAVRKERAELEAKLAVVKQRELDLTRTMEVKKHGYFTRVEVKGRLTREVFPMRGLFGADAIIWTLTSGENSFELFLDGKSMENVKQIAEKQVGKSVLVSGDLIIRRHPIAPIVVVKTLAAADK